jgi:hypothetical protein
VHISSGRNSGELLEQKSYLRNFWYCAGECGLASTLFYESQRMAKQQQCSGGGNPSPQWGMRKVAWCAFGMLWVLLADFFDKTCWLQLLLLLPSSHTALSESLTDDAPLGVDILGSRVVLFREGDSIKCLDDTCPHR